jgi:hypothetical protein
VKVPHTFRALGRVSAEFSPLSDGDLMAALQREYRALARQQGRVNTLLSEICEREPPHVRVPGSSQFPWPSAVAEVRAELRLTRAATESEVAFSRGITIDRPAIGDALADGRIDRQRAWTLWDHTRDLTDVQADEVLGALLPRAVELTSSQLAERARRMAIALDPKWAARRYRTAVRDRRVVGYLNPDGSGTFAGLNLRADDVAAAGESIHDLALQIKRAGHPGTLQHLRADLYIALLDGRLVGMSRAEIVASMLAEANTDADSGAPPTDPAPVGCPGGGSGPRFGALAGVEIRVGLATLLGRNDQPGDLPGLGPLLADDARRLVARQHRGEWRWVVVDDRGRWRSEGLTRRRPVGAAAHVQARGGIVELQVSERLLADLAEQADTDPSWAGVIADIAAQHAAYQTPAQDPGARFPNAATRRHIEILMRGCTMPPCRRSARRSEQDHLRMHAAGGPTLPENLHPACGPDHDLHTRGGWTVRRTPYGDVIWTSRLGRVHRSTPEPVTEPLPDPRPRPGPIPGGSNRPEQDPDPPPV